MKHSKTEATSQHEEMNTKMDIPTKIEDILDKDIPLMIKRAQAESILLYPVPKILKNNELAYLYKVIQGK